MNTKPMPRVVCLCGSTRFKAEFVRANERETMAGRIVLSVGFFGHADGLELTEAQKATLDELHLRKIDKADEVLVIDAPVGWCGGCRRWVNLAAVLPGYRCQICGTATEARPYVGESTRREIEYAAACGKPVRYLSKESAR